MVKPKVLNLSHTLTFPCCPSLSLLQHWCIVSKLRLISFIPAPFQMAAYSFWSLYYVEKCVSYHIRKLDPGHSRIMSILSLSSCSQQVIRPYEKLHNKTWGSHWNIWVIYFRVQNQTTLDNVVFLYSEDCLSWLVLFGHLAVLSAHTHAPKLGFPMDKTAGASQKG